MHLLIFRSSGSKGTFASLSCSTQYVRSSVRPGFRLSTRAQTNSASLPADELFPPFATGDNHRGPEDHSSSASIEEAGKSSSNQTQGDAGRSSLKQRALRQERGKRASAESAAAKEDIPTNSSLRKGWDPLKKDKSTDDRDAAHQSGVNALDSTDKLTASRSAVVGALRDLQAAIRASRSDPQSRDDACAKQEPTDEKGKSPAVEQTATSRKHAASSTGKKGGDANKKGDPTSRAAKSKPRSPNMSSFTLHKLPALANLKFTPIPDEQPPVPRLAYGLDRVLFNPGVYRLQDPRTRVFNFDPYLEKIMPASEFDFDALAKYVTSSEDPNLIKVSKDRSKRYVGSTSSLTSLLSHFHFLLSKWRKPNMRMLSSHFEEVLESFTQLSRAPAATFLRYHDGSYAIDSDKEFSTSNILSLLGRSMEKMLTLSEEEYERYRKTNAIPGVEPSKEEPQADSFHYSTIGDFVLRSQLDAYDPRLPGTGMFDLKTRAVVTVRMDVSRYKKLRDYEIVTNLGEWESFEREYHDMIRAAFLKYSLQVRMGRMDGIFVAYHNTQRIFGFQYIPLEEMDYALHGQTDRLLGDAEFKYSMSMLNEILDMFTKEYPRQSLRLMVETRESDVDPFMYFFAEPVTENQIRDIQSKAAEETSEEEHALLESSPNSRSTEKNTESPLDETEDKDGVDSLSVPSDSYQEPDHGVLSSSPTHHIESAADKGQDRVPNLVESLFTDPEEHIPARMQASDSDSVQSLEGAIDASLRSDQSTGLEDGEDSEADESTAHETVGAEIEGPQVADANGAVKARSRSTPVATRPGSGVRAPASKSQGASPPTDRKLMMIRVHIRNTIDDESVERPTHLTQTSGQWRVAMQYRVEKDNHAAWKTYTACQARRKQVLGRDRDFATLYRRKLEALSTKGRKLRKKLSAEQPETTEVVG